MKKFLIISLIFAAAAIAAPSAEARTVDASSVKPTSMQVYVQRRGRNWNRRYRRTVIRTRTRWIGPYRYRETIRMTYLPNGRVRTDVIRRVRLSGRRW